MDQNQHYYKRISTDLLIPAAQVAATALLLAEGGTVPLISRYRKEATGSLDEVQVAAIRDQLAVMAELEKWRLTIMESLATRGLLTPELQAGLQGASNLATLEDLYPPYRQKRKTPALMAMEKGLEPLARAIFDGRDQGVDTAACIDPEKERESGPDFQDGKLTRNSKKNSLHL